MGRCTGKVHIRILQSCTTAADAIHGPIKSWTVFSVFRSGTCVLGQVRGDGAWQNV